MSEQKKSLSGNGGMATNMGFRTESEVRQWQKVKEIEINESLKHDRLEKHKLRGSLDEEVERQLSILKEKQIKINGGYTCELCEEVFGTKSELANHYKHADNKQSHIHFCVYNCVKLALGETFEKIFPDVCAPMTVVTRSLASNKGFVQRMKASKNSEVVYGRLVFQQGGELGRKNTQSAGHIQYYCKMCDFKMDSNKRVCQHINESTHKRIYQLCQKFLDGTHAPRDRFDFLFNDVPCRCVSEENIGENYMMAVNSATIMPMVDRRLLTIGNLPVNLGQNQLMSLLRDYGPVRILKIKRNLFSWMAVVEMKTEFNASLAMVDLDYTRCFRGSDWRIYLKFADKLDLEDENFKKEKLMLVEDVMNLIKSSSGFPYGRLKNFALKIVREEIEKISSKGKVYLEEAIEFLCLHEPYVSILSRPFHNLAPDASTSLKNYIMRNNILTSSMKELVGHLTGSEQMISSFLKKLKKRLLNTRQSQRIHLFSIGSLLHFIHTQCPDVSVKINSIQQFKLPEVVRNVVYVGGLPISAIEIKDFIDNHIKGSVDDIRLLDKGDYSLKHVVVTTRSHIIAQEIAAALDYAKFPGCEKPIQVKIYDKWDEIALPDLEHLRLPQKNQQQSSLTSASPSQAVLIPGLDSISYQPQNVDVPIDHFSPRKQDIDERIQPHISLHQEENLYRDVDLRDHSQAEPDIKPDLVENMIYGGGDSMALYRGEKQLDSSGQALLYEERRRSSESMRNVEPSLVPYRQSRSPDNRHHYREGSPRRSSLEYGEQQSSHSRRSESPTYRSYGSDRGRYDDYRNSPIRMRPQSPYDDILGDEYKSGSEYNRHSDSRSRYPPAESDSSFSREEYSRYESLNDSRDRDRRRRNSSERNLYQEREDVDRGRYSSSRRTAPGSPHRHSHYKERSQMRHSRTNRSPMTRERKSSRSRSPYEQESGYSERRVISIFPSSSAQASYDPTSPTRSPNRESIFSYEEHERRITMGSSLKSTERDQSPDNTEVFDSLYERLQRYEKLFEERGSEKHPATLSKPHRVFQEEEEEEGHSRKVRSDIHRQGHHRPHSPAREYPSTHEDQYSSIQKLVRSGEIMSRKEFYAEKEKYLEEKRRMLEEKNREYYKRGHHARRYSDERHRSRSRSRSRQRRSRSRSSSRRRVHARYERRSRSRGRRYSSTRDRHGSRRSRSQSISSGSSYCSDTSFTISSSDESRNNQKSPLNVSRRKRYRRSPRARTPRSPLRARSPNLNVPLQLGANIHPPLQHQDMRFPPPGMFHPGVAPPRIPPPNIPPPDVGPPGVSPTSLPSPGTPQGRAPPPSLHQPPPPGHMPAMGGPPPPRWLPPTNHPPPQRFLPPPGTLPHHLPPPFMRPSPAMGMPPMGPPPGHLGPPHMAPGGMPMGPPGIPMGPPGMPMGPSGMPVGPCGIQIGPPGMPVGPGGSQMDSTGKKTDEKAKAKKNARPPKVLIQIKKK